MKYSFFILSIISVFSLAAMETPIDLEAQPLTLNDQCKILIALRCEEESNSQALKHLNLSSTKIKNLESDINDLVTMKEFHNPEQKNKLLQSPTILSAISLKTLDLSCNKLKLLPESFNTLQNLKHIDLGSNKFETFPEILCSLPELTDINIRYNQITDIPASISKLTNLKKFDVSHNKLTKIPEQIDKLQYLKTFDTTENSITEPVSDKVRALIGWSRALDIELSSKGLPTVTYEKMVALYQKLSDYRRRLISE